MNAKPLAFFAFLIPSIALGQGFAGLGSTSDGFTLPDPDTRFEFPQDHGPHPGFRIEWWYVTANLVSADGQRYGIQWTLFRNALTPGLATDAEAQIWMGHAGLTTPDRHFSAERFARGGMGLAGVTTDPFSARIDEWRMEGETLSDVNLFAQGTDFAYDLDLTATGPFVPQGIEGYSVKSEAGQASHYYSQPFYGVEGTLTLLDEPVTVTGRAWLDREWSSQPLTGTQTGWDWISLHLEDGEKLMGYRLRDADGTAYTVGTWIAADGTPTPLSPGELTMTAEVTTRIADQSIPTTWSVSLPARDLSVTVEALNPESWMDVSVSYWEGPVTVTGSHGGEGYLEMTGYE